MTIRRIRCTTAGLARNVFEAVERARVEAIGALRMRGVAANLTAKTEARFDSRAAAAQVADPARPRSTRRSL